MRRGIAVLALTFGLVVATAGSAFAHVCFPVNKPPGAGAGGTATFNLDTFEFTIDSADLTKTGQFKGGFLTVNVVSGGETLASYDTFAHNTLPARFQPSGEGCDGIGIDDAETCVMQLLGG